MTSRIRWDKLASKLVKWSPTPPFADLPAADACEIAYSSRCAPSNIVTGMAASPGAGECQARLAPTSARRSQGRDYDRKGDFPRCTGCDRLHCTQRNEGRPTMCFDDDSHPPMPLSDGSSAWGEDVTIRSADGAEVRACLAASHGPVAAQVVILPDVRGLHNFYRELALRFADVGMRAIVMDYFARTAVNDNRDDTFEYMPHVEQMTPATFRQDLEATLSYLQSGDGARIPTFTVGFCMGGSLSFQAGTLGPGLHGVIGFYAGLTRTRGAVTPVLEFVDRIDAPLLGLFGGADQGIPQEDVIRLDEALDRASKEHEIVVYPEAPHSFFDRKAGEFAAASADAWSRVQGFIADHGPVRV